MDSTSPFSKSVCTIICPLGCKRLFQQKNANRHFKSCKIYAGLGLEEQNAFMNAQKELKATKKMGAKEKRKQKEAARIRQMREQSKGIATRSTSADPAYRKIAKMTFQVLDTNLVESNITFGVPGPQQDLIATPIKGGKTKPELEKARLKAYRRTHPLSEEQKQANIVRCKKFRENHLNILEKNRGDGSLGAKNESKCEKKRLIKEQAKLKKKHTHGIIIGTQIIKRIIYPLHIKREKLKANVLEIWRRKVIYEKRIEQEVKATIKNLVEEVIQRTDEQITKMKKDRKMSSIRQTAIPKIKFYSGTRSLFHFKTRLNSSTNKRVLPEAVLASQISNVLSSQHTPGANSSNIKATQIQQNMLRQKLEECTVKHQFFLKRSLALLPTIKKYTPTRKPLTGRTREFYEMLDGAVDSMLVSNKVSFAEKLINRLQTNLCALSSKKLQYCAGYCFLDSKKKWLKKMVFMAEAADGRPESVHCKCLEDFIMTEYYRVRRKEIRTQIATENWHARLAREGMPEWHWIDEY